MTNPAKLFRMRYDACDESSGALNAVCLKTGELVNRFNVKKV